MPAPVALFTYNRPIHTRRTLDALKANELASQSDLFLFSDGPKNEADRPKVEATRKIIESVTGFKSVTLVFSPQNRGLANSIISGVTSVVEKFGRVVVLEDDLVTSPGFLRYMNEALELYEKDERVISIHGYLYPVRMTLPETFFLKGADCWGWATWKRGWDLFEADGVRLRRELEIAGLLDRFDFGGTYSYTDMLEGQIAGRNDSWAVRWYASALVNGKLTLYPGCSLVSNIGHDEEGTNTTSQTDSFDVAIADEVNVGGVPICESEEAYQAFKSYFESIAHRPGIFARLRSARLRATKVLKTIARGILPPVLVRSLRNPVPEYGFFGDYPDWASARTASSGYDEPAILSKVRDAVLAVKEGRAAYERDSVVFEKPDYPWPLLGCLFRVASARGNHLRVADFGGSLGSSYFQCRLMLSGLQRLEWSVVEQPHFVEEGRRVIGDGVLKFYFDMEECLAERKPDVLLLSSVLSYLPDPYACLESLLRHRIPYIIVDRTPFLSGAEDRLTVQKVPPVIYQAAYPAWFFSERKFRRRMADDYEEIAEFNCNDETTFPSRFKGFLFKLRDAK